MNRLTRVMAVMVTAAPLVLTAALATGSAARAATVYPPGGPDQTAVMGWSGWSFQYVNLDDGWYQCPGPQGRFIGGPLPQPSSRLRQRERRPIRPSE
jgi:hypothetical protein